MPHLVFARRKGLQVIGDDRCGRRRHPRCRSVRPSSSGALRPDLPQCLHCQTQPGASLLHFPVSTQRTFVHRGGGSQRMVAFQLLGLGLGRAGDHR